MFDQHSLQLTWREYIFQGQVNLSGTLHEDAHASWAAYSLQGPDSSLGLVQFAKIFGFRYCSTSVFI
jgi:hypothetical protein